MAKEEQRIQCAATTRAGNRCKNRTLPGSAYCQIHLTMEIEEEDDQDRPVVDVEATVRRDSVQEKPGEDYATEELAQEIDELIDELRSSTSDFTPPPFSPKALIALIRQSLDQLPPPMRLDLLLRLRDAVRSEGGPDMETWQGVWYLLHYWRHYQELLVQRLATVPLQQIRSQLEKVSGVLSEDVLDLETWKGLWFMASYSVKYQAGLVRRRFSGEYDTDDWGLDWELLDAVRPLFTFLYKYYWRVKAGGLEHIPDYERALIVSNHSGQLPFDGAMVGAAILLEHPSQRLVRNLYADWFPTLPFLAPFLEKMGQTLASVDNGTRLLEQEELVAVYPEGYKGVGKLFKDRYRLARFGRGGFVKMALKTGAPIIPTAVVGAEETYISLAKSDLLARLTGFPYFPISPTWPWLGLLGLIPLPTRWYIDFGEPVSMDGYAPEDAENLVLVSQLTDQVRNIIQEMLYERLAERRSVFLG